MKDVFVVANWKSNKTQKEAVLWMHEIAKIKYELLKQENKHVVVCPSFTVLPSLHSFILEHSLPVFLAAQDMSPFGEGAYTGEVNGAQIKEFADFVVVGHSERRENFSETEEMIDEKLEQCLNNNLNPILCISNINQIQNSKFKIQNYSSKCKSLGLILILAYEPISAIGTGKADTPENANAVAEDIKNELGDVPVLYGGSVTSENVQSFVSAPYIDGVLVGGASLDSESFIDIVLHA